MTKTTKTKAAAAPIQSPRTIAALRAHLTRATNALAETGDRAEKRALRERIQSLQSRIGA